MKLLSAFFLFFVLSFRVIAAPQFKDYPVELYTGKPQAFIADKETRVFKTRFKEAGNKVDFAGHYSIGGFGCGALCQHPIAVDLKTGKGNYLVGATTGCYKEGGYIESETYYKPDSRLFIFAGQLDGDNEDADKCLIHYYVEENGKLKLIDKQPFAKSPEQ